MLSGIVVPFPRRAALPVVDLERLRVEAQEFPPRELWARALEITVRTGRCPSRADAEKLYLAALCLIRLADETF